MKPKDYINPQTECLIFVSIQLRVWETKEEKKGKAYDAWELFSFLGQKDEE